MTEKKAPRKYRTGRHLTDPPGNELERVADHIEWLLYLPQLGEVVTQHVPIRRLVQSLIDVGKISFTQDANPNEVMLAWQILLDVMGPDLFHSFISVGAWRDFTPFADDDRDTRSLRILWTNGSQDVAIRLTYVADMPSSYKLSVDNRTF
jgi:hypothetical protein